MQVRRGVMATGLVFCLVALATSWLGRSTVAAAVPLPLVTGVGSGVLNSNGGPLTVSVTLNDPTTARTFTGQVALVIGVRGGESAPDLDVSYLGTGATGTPTAVTPTSEYGVNDAHAYEAPAADAVTVAPGTSTTVEFQVTATGSPSLTLSASGRFMGPVGTAYSQQQQILPYDGFWPTVTVHGVSISVSGTPAVIKTGDPPSQFKVTLANSSTAPLAVDQPQLEGLGSGIGFSMSFMGPGYPTFVPAPVITASGALESGIGPDAGLQLAPQSTSVWTVRLSANARAESGDGYIFAKAPLVPGPDNVASVATGVSSQLYVESPIVAVTAPTNGIEANTGPTPITLQATGLTGFVNTALEITVGVSGDSAVRPSTISVAGIDQKRVVMSSAGGSLVGTEPMASLDSEPALPGLTGIEVGLHGEIPPGSITLTVRELGAVVSGAPRRVLATSSTIRIPVVTPLTAPITGYSVVWADGSSFPFGGNPAVPQPRNPMSLNAPIVGAVSAVEGDPLATGTWLVARDGGVFTEGPVPFLGSMGGRHLNEPIVGMTATPDGGGYWLVASDGGIFAFGDAQFYGSMGGHRLNQPVVAMASSADGHGYWMVAKDGGIFTLGDAPFFGSAVGQHVKEPVESILPGQNGRGYALLEENGGVHNYGNFPFYGSFTVSFGETDAPAPIPAVALTR